MRILVATLIGLTYSAVTWSTPWLPPVRDGAWLQNGVKEQQRWNAHETLSEKELNDATLVTSYICAVVDLEKELVQRATQLASALQADKRQKHLDPHLLDGMTHAVPILVPLAKSDFATDSPSCDRALTIVGDYLTTYPEMLDKDADAIVEKALLAKYDRSTGS